MTPTEVSRAEIIQDGLDLLVVCDNKVALLAVLEVMGELSPETIAAIWEQLPAENYKQLQQWAIALLLDSSIVGDQLFPNDLSPTQRVLTAFRVLPTDLKKQIWSSIPSSRREELKSA
ncbi:MAG TPA: hypothetical protein V6D15_08505 [Oculatellaceae cyanobacterium]|jgi:hypothetical protein